MNIVTRAPKVVFAGGGHAHLHSLLRTGELTRRGFGVTLINPSPHLYYSGMATGVISVVYAPDEHRIDVRRLVEEGGGTFVEGRVEEVRAQDREFVLEEGGTVPYDAASVCLGSEVPRNGFEKSEAAAVRVKPIEHTGEIRHDSSPLRKVAHPRSSSLAGAPRAARWRPTPWRCSTGWASKARSRSLRGAGPSWQWRQRRRGSRSSGFLPRRARGSSRTPPSPPLAAAWTRDGHEIPCDVPVLATGISPPGVFRASSLTTGQDGGLWVDQNLRSVNHGCLFGSGDCISYRGEALPKLGVFAVRQGPVLFHNLQAALEGEPLKPYKPQKRFLYILNLGDGTGPAVYGSLVWRGRLSFMLKHRIDEKFVSHYRR